MTHASEVARGERFEFGKNWSRFLGTLTGERIASAEQALREKLECDDLTGLSFLDIGCGSGLMSLAARRLGATVTSIDFDPDSVGCARKLRQQFFGDDPNWRIEPGSVLDGPALAALGQFDIVYCWGVMHHTGAMHLAMDNVTRPVAERGRLFIALYNHQPRKSPRWVRIKKFYCGLPRALKLPFTVAMFLPREIPIALRYLLTLRPDKYVTLWTDYSKKRGMSRWHDFVDWLGGYPFETAKPEEVVHFYRDRGLLLEQLKTVGGGSGCNEFVFRKQPATSIGSLPHPVSASSTKKAA